MSLVVAPLTRRSSSTVRLVVAALALAAAAGCVPPGIAPPPRPSPGDSLFAQRLLSELMRDNWNAILPRRPELALDAGYLVAGFAELSYEATRDEGRVAQEIGRKLERLNVDALAPSDYLTFLALQWDVNTRAEGALFHGSDFSILSPAESPLREIVAWLPRHPLTSPAHLERYLYMLDVLPSELGRIQESLVERRTRGYVATRDEVRSAIAFLRGLRALGPEGPWYVAPARIAAVDSIERRIFVADATLAIDKRLLPSLDSLATWLERDYLPVALERPGLWQHAGGKEHYRHLLRRKSSIEITPEQAHGVGLATLRRVDSLLAATRTRLGVTGGVGAFHDSLRRSLPALDDSALVARVREVHGRLAATIEPRVLRTPPPAPVVSMATPWERLAFPEGGWFRDSMHAGGRIALTPRWRTATARLTLAARAARLGQPGRALQRSVVLANDSLAPLRALLESRAFVEGWQEYAAALAGELGLYADPVDAYGRLMDEGLAAAFLVVDTGVHYLGWSRAQAMTVLRRYSLESDAALDSLFVERVVNDPAGAAARLLGARELAAQRTWMSRELAPDFDLRAWHATVLREGALPLPIEAAHLEQWLYEVRRARAAAAAAARDSARKAALPRKPR